MLNKYSKTQYFVLSGILVSTEHDLYNSLPHGGILFLPVVNHCAPGFSTDPAGERKWTGRTCYKGTVIQLIVINALSVMLNFIQCLSVMNNPLKYGSYRTHDTSLRKSLDFNTPACVFDWPARSMTRVAYA